MRRWLLAVSLLCQVAAPAAEPLLLDAGRDPGYWSPARGSEFPGASVDLSLDAADGPCILADVTFTGESRYAGAEWRGTVPQGSAVGFKAKPSSAGYLDVRLQDATGQWFMQGQNVTGGQWNDVVVNLAGPFSNHWSGANDGVLHFPLQRVLIAVPRKPDRQQLRLKHLHVVVDAIPAEQRWEIRWAPGGASGVALLNESVSYGLTLVNRTASDQTTALRVTSETVDGEPVEKLAETRSIAGFGAASWTVPFETGQLGYRVIRATLDGSPAAGVTALAVVPRARHYGEWATDAYFGIQHLGDMEAAERLGAKAVRHFLFWRYSEGRKGLIRFEEPYMDGVVNACGEHKMDLLLTVCLTSPSWNQWQRPDKPKAVSLPDPARADEYRGFVQAIASRYADRPWLRAIEIENEPDLTCVRNPELTLDEGTDYYVTMLRAGAAGARAGKPGVTVAGSGVSGGDMDRPLPFTKAVLDKAGDAIDLLAAHPYASPREFGPGKHPKWPKANREAEKCVEALDALEAHGKPRRMWIGELGWCLSTEADPLSRYSLDYSACVAQSLVTAKSVPGVERYLHFTLRGANERGYEYGLLRGDPSWPLPAAVMYAAAAWHLEDARPVERRDIGDKLRVATFAHEGRNELIAVFMADDDAQAVQLPPGAPRGVWLDSLFRELAPVQGKVPVGAMPVYWTTPLDAEVPQPDFWPRVQQVPARLVELQDVRLSRVDRLAVRAVNHSGQPQPVTVAVDGRETKLPLPAGDGVQELQVPLPQPVAMDRQTTFAITLTAAGATLQRTVSTTPAALPPVPANLRVDGRLDEWTAAGWLVDQKDDVLPPDPHVGWSGPEDLSLRVRLAASPAGLGIAVAVTDDVHHIGASDPGRFWQSDSLQIAIDPLNDGGEALDPQDRELGMILASDGPHLLLSHPGTARKLQVPVAIVRNGTSTVYEVVVPWRAINLDVPESGRVMAINVVANDDDGQGRAYWMGLTPGVAEAKTPMVYREFVVGR